MMTEGVGGNLFEEDLPEASLSNISSMHNCIANIPIDLDTNKEKPNRIIKKKM